MRESLYLASVGKNTSTDEAAHPSKARFVDLRIGQGRFHNKACSQQTSLLQQLISSFRAK